jgi:hypothetical protein
VAPLFGFRLLRAGVDRIPEIFGNSNLPFAQIRSILNYSMKRLAYITIVAAVFFFTACDDLFNENTPAKNPWGDEASVSVSLTVDAGETIYLVKYNPSAQDVPAQYTGNMRSVVLGGGASASVAAGEPSRTSVTPPPS